MTTKTLPVEIGDMKYRTVVADPPWAEYGGGKIKRGADRHYPLMKQKEIIEYLYSIVTEECEYSCHLYLWVTNNFLKDGLDVIEKLGFRYITTITWVKDRIGLGQYYKGITEHCLFCVRGKFPYKIVNGKRMQGSTGFIAPKNRHSEKPGELYAMVEKVSYGPYLEVFARKPRDGWSVKGNEVENDN